MTEIKYYAIIRELQISERERVRVRNLNESVCAYLKKRLPGKLHFTFPHQANMVVFIEGGYCISHQNYVC